MWKWMWEGKVNKHSHDIMLELRLEAIAYIAKSEWINFMASKISKKIAMPEKFFFRWMDVCIVAESHTS